MRLSAIVPAVACGLFAASVAWADFYGPPGTTGPTTNPVTVAQGGTGATTSAAALASLGAAANGPNADITSLAALSTPLPITEGGTASTTSAAALSALGAAANGANADITSLSAITTPIPTTEGGTGIVTCSQNFILAGPSSGGAGPLVCRAMQSADMAPYIAPKSTVAGLPSCTVSIEGAVRVVTDATLPTLLSVLTGGSTTVVLALCNGSSWVAA
jgi:hypothetical protein